MCKYQSNENEICLTVSRCRVFHLCAAIRYWERASYTFSHSKRVNVDGTKHVLQCLQEMPDTSDKVLVYSSTASVCTPPPLLMRLGLNHKGFSATYKISDRFPIPDALRARFAYAATKALADQEVRQANGVGGIRTGVVSDFQTLPLDSY